MHIPNIILFDADGVVLKPHRYFSEHYAETQKVDLNKITPFFKTTFQDCLVGKADLKAELGKRLAEWEWNGTVDELLDMWFLYESNIDERIINHVAELRSKDIQCYIHTNNEKYRTEYVWNTLHLKNHFDGIFSSAELGYKKPAQEFWNAVYERLNPKDKKGVLVWDDETENVESAKVFAFEGRVYEDYSKYILQESEFLRID